MSLVHALLLFVGGPAVIIALCYLLGAAMSRDTESAKTYTLGDKWEHGTLWFVGHPREGVSSHQGVATIEAGNEHVPSATMVGGASGTW